MKCKEICEEMKKYVCIYYDMKERYNTNIYYYEYKLVLIMWGSYQKLRWQLIIISLINKSWAINEDRI